MTFESLRHQVSHLVHESREPMTFPQLRDVCDMAADDKQLVDTVFQMCKAEELKRHPAPDGSGRGVKFAYGPGKNKPGAEAQGGGDPKTKRAKGAHPKKRKHKVRKVQRKPAASRPPREPHPKGITGWVLTAEGAFVLLGRQPAIQVKAESARTIVELVRAGADLDGLVEFIKKLDEGKA